jgi:hypothetical protein
MMHVDPVQLVYEKQEKNLYPHWVLMAPDTYNHEYYADMFRTKTPYSERAQWLEEHFGKGGFHAGQYPNQKWFVYEGPKMRWGNERNPDEAAVCFRDETDALMFKMRWT